MQEIEKFLDLAVAGIRDKRKKADVRAELEDHVTEKFEEYKRRGYSDQESERRAVEEMGDRYELFTHRYDTRQPNKTDFEDGWTKVCTYQLKK